MNFKEKKICGGNKKLEKKKRTGGFLCNKAKLQLKIEGPPLVAFLEKKL